MARPVRWRNKQNKQTAEFRPSFWINYRGYRRSQYKLEIFNRFFDRLLNPNRFEVFPEEWGEFAFRTEIQMQQALVKDQATAGFYSL